MDPLGSNIEMADWQPGYSALVSSCALVARSDRGFVTVAGQRRAEMINGLVTQKVTDLSDQGRHALLLTAKGRVLTDMRVLPRANHLLLDVPQGGLGNLKDAFKKYLPPLYATFEDASDTISQLGVYGPRADAAVGEALGSVPSPGHLALAELDVDGMQVLVIRNERMVGGGLEVIAPAADSEALSTRLLEGVERHEGLAADQRAFEVLRIESGVPRYGADISEANLAQETGLEDIAVSYEKGCYLGQEVVARVHFRGHVNRHLRGLKFEDDLPVAGAKLFAGEKEVGVVTSSAQSPDLGPIGLGYVRHEIETPATLRWSEGSTRGAVRVGPLQLRAV